MNKFMIMMALIMSFGTGTVYADQRFETDGGYCHFSYDVNDADNEVYFANCLNTIDTYDAADGQGRLAMGDSNVKKKYTVRDATFIQALREGNIFLKGNQAGEPYGDRYTTSNAPCVMVTANYDAGNDDQNETVYVSNDWNMEIITAKFKKGEAFDKGNIRVHYKLSCRGGVAQ